MKQIIPLLAALALALSCSTQKAVTVIDNPQPVLGDETDVSPNTLIIMYDTEAGKEPLLKAVEQYGAELIYDYSIIPGIAIGIPDGTDIHEAIAFFRKVKGVISVERDRIYHLTDPVMPKTEVL